MLRLYADKFVGISGFHQQMVITYLNPSPVGASAPAPSPLSDGSLALLKERVEAAKRAAAEINLTDTIEILDRLQTAIGDPADQRRHMVSNYADGISSLFSESAIRMQAELKKRYFVEIAADREQWYELGANAFGAAVLGAFGSASEDIEEASKSYALERHSACVFHCMRIVGRGLKALATDVNVQFETKMWGTVISSIEGKVKEIRTNGIPGMDKAAKDARLQFLSEAAKEFAYFKDGWRNYVFHDGPTYDQGQAASVLEHTRSFMVQLATRLSE